MSGVCCSIRIKTGVLMIGILTATLSLIPIIIINTVVSVMNDLDFYTIIITPLFLEVLTSILLIIGVIMNHWTLMMPWLLTSSLLLYMLFHYQIMMWIFTIHQEPLVILGIIVESLIMSLFVYFMTVVYRYAKEIRKALLTNA